MLIWHLKDTIASYMNRRAGFKTVLDVRNRNPNSYMSGNKIKIIPNFKVVISN